jgi:hypothetical protein
MVLATQIPAVTSVDGADRIADFLSRHGGPANREEREGDMAEHTQGWSEVYAADGYRLRCDWSRAGSMTKMSFREIPPS